MESIAIASILETFFQQPNEIKMHSYKFLRLLLLKQK